MTEITYGVTPPSMSFGERLRELRMDAGIRQNALAAAIGVGFPYISKIERPDGPTPAPEVISKIAEALKLDEAKTSELFALAAKMPPALEQRMVKEPEAMDFYRAAYRHVPDEKRREFFRGLIEKLERENEPPAKDEEG